MYSWTEESVGVLELSTSNESLGCKESLNITNGLKSELHNFLEDTIFLL